VLQIFRRSLLETLLLDDPPYQRKLVHFRFDLRRRITHWHRDPNIARTETVASREQRRSL
jgi:hypothetical protein